MNEVAEGRTQVSLHQIHESMSSHEPTPVYVVTCTADQHATEMCCGCRAAVQAAMDAAAAASAFSKKRGRKEGEDGDDGKAEHDVGGGKNRIKGGDSSGDDDEEEDIIPLKRPLIAPRPAPKQPQRPQASGGALPSGRVETLARTAAAAAAGQNEAATAATPASHGKTDSAKPLQEGCEQRATGCNIPVTIPPVAKPPVAAPMRPPVARGPSRDVQSGKDGT